MYRQNSGLPHPFRGFIAEGWESADSIFAVFLPHMTLVMPPTPTTHNPSQQPTHPHHQILKSERQILPF